MSSDKRWVLSKIPPGKGRVLDLGGGRGALYQPISDLGYEYFNIDMSPRGKGWRIRGDAHRLPLGDDLFDVVVSSDTLEHFADPLLAMTEARRVLKPEGRFVIWVPFMQPFHENDYYRYTPLGLRWLMDQAGFRISSFEAPLWIFSVFAQALLVLFQKIHLGFLETTIEAIAEKLDHLFSRFRSDDVSFAAYFLVVAAPKEPDLFLEAST